MASNLGHVVTVELLCITEQGISRIFWQQFPIPTLALCSGMEGVRISISPFGDSNIKIACCYENRFKVKLLSSTCKETPNLYTLLYKTTGITTARNSSQLRLSVAAPFLPFLTSSGVIQLTTNFVNSLCVVRPRLKIEDRSYVNRGSRSQIAGDRRDRRVEDFQEVKLCRQ